ncbi:MAG: ATP-dependent helicase, partial [Rhodoferax sp.]|nr:ATP-dependent helicase [Rhodoferax sp.]
NATASTVEQHFYSVDDEAKRPALRQILQQRGIRQAFVFVNSKLGCARLARALEREGLNTTALHGDKSQDERLKALDAFKKGEVDLLVCTDVAARGLDIKDVPAVFNFDIPFNAEDYVHRIGRTGRAGASGLAVSFVSRSDARQLADIEKLIRVKVELEALELDDQQPDIRRQGRFNDGQRLHGDRHREGRSPRREPSESRAPAPVRQDPFFDQPYEPAAAAAAAPAWEATARPGPRSVSANIKPKRRVAALFKPE